MATVMFKRVPLETRWCNCLFWRRSEGTR